MEYKRTKSNHNSVDSKDHDDNKINYSAIVEDPVEE